MLYGRIQSFRQNYWKLIRTQSTAELNRKLTKGMSRRRSMRAYFWGDAPSTLSQDGNTSAHAPCHTLCVSGRQYICACAVPHPLCTFDRRAVAARWVWSGSQCVRKHARLLLRPILARRQSFTCMKIFPLRHTALVLAFRLFADHASHTLHHR